jgi:hypothetical protein
MNDATLAESLHVGRQNDDELKIVKSPINPNALLEAVHAHRHLTITRIRGEFVDDFTKHRR